ncbi:hypothetical protein FRC14_007641 [Serendipita sp. 396]|nr:hypothetical protein FRC14_007641 [Serendipita sp. 396]
MIEYSTSLTLSLLSKRSVSGNGCPVGTVSYAFNDRKTTLTFSFSNYYVIIGQDYPFPVDKKDCAIRLGMYVPPCYSFTIPTVDYYGYYELDSKVKGVQRTAYWLKSRTKKAFSRLGIKGPFEGGSYQYVPYKPSPSRSVPLSPTSSQAFTHMSLSSFPISRMSSIPLSFDGWPLVRSACCDGEMTLNIENSLRVDNSANNHGSGLIDFVTKGFKTTLNLDWAKCCFDSTCSPQIPNGKR